MSQAEDPRRLRRKRDAQEVTVEDIRQLMGASTPHFALQLRNRIANLIAEPGMMLRMLNTISSKVAQECGSK